MENENKTLTKKIDLKSFIVPRGMWNEEGNYTKDLVYCHSSDDLKKIPFNERCVYPTDYAVMNGCWMRRPSDHHGYLYLSDNLDRFLDLIKDCDYQTQKMFITHEKRLSCRVWLRSPDGVDRAYLTDWDGCRGTEYVASNDQGICPALRLDISAVISARKSSQDVFKIGECKSGYGNLIHHTIEFGEYPKTYVGKKMNKKLEKLYSRKKLANTSKIYTGHIDGNGKFASHSEFEYEGQKYVRVITEKGDDESQFSDGTMAPKSGTPLWVKVEPITWKIVNWEQMPRSINPQGAGSANFIAVRTENAITSGIPFYINRVDENCSMWQNSAIRAYLNGYDLHLEIVAEGNGKHKYIAKQNYDFTKNNFLTEALSGEMVLIKDICECVEKSDCNVKKSNKPLSVDKEIKFYIENGKSFMLHGPSGVGKTRRIEEADPEFVSIVLRNGMSPQEVIGKTINDDKTKTDKWIAPVWYQALCKKCKKEPNKKHVLFIDMMAAELKPSEQDLVLNLLLNRSIGPNVGKLPKNAVVVGADSMEEANMQGPLFHRFDTHVYLKSDVRKWLEWGSKPTEISGRLRIHPLVASYVATFGKFYSSHEAKDALDARTWEQISDIIYDNDGNVPVELVESKAGKDIAASLADFAKTSPITISNVIEGNFEEDKIPMNFDEKFALAMSLRNANFEQIEKVRKFVDKYLGNEILVYFDNTWVGKDDKKAIFLQKLKQKQTESQTEKQQ